MDYGTRLTNPYRPLINSSQAATYLKAYDRRCLPELNTCGSSGTDAACKKADNTCFDPIEGQIQTGSNVDFYDLRASSQDRFPPRPTSLTFRTPLSSLRSVLNTYTKECPDAPYDKFAATGGARSYSAAFKYSYASGRVTLTGITTAGVQAVISQLGGVQYGVFKTAGNLSFLKVSTQATKYQPNSLAAGIRTDPQSAAFVFYIVVLLRIGLLLAAQ
ncbi:hypothetical protein EDB89DRAFT_2231230 [Lactarius sanguifluus]|nr:hypothetical protein EDB89DRAFT_2231230 [Lactarius sanguifluus]